MAEFRMPSLGSDMEAGTLIEWRVKPGDRVRRRDVIAVVETEKAAIEIEVYEDGIVEALLVQPGQKVAVGTVMAIIRTAAEPEADAPDRPLPAEPSRSSAAGQDAPAAEPAPASIPAQDARVNASPYARRLAAEHGVDLRLVKGTGPQGAIGAADVQRAAATALSPQRTAPTAAEETTVATPLQPAAPVEKPVAKAPQTAMRRAIAAAMARSKREIPHYYLQTRIDMRPTLDWLTEENLKRPIKERILPVVPLLRAVVLALKEVPELNGFWVDGSHRISDAVHLGFVINLRQGGLIAPALLDANDKGVDELVADLRDLITRARSGGLRSSEITDATITVTSLGDLGVETVFGVIYPPQVALVGFGKIMEQPWAENGMLGVRPILTATLSADHRATDGHLGARFLDALNRHLQEPSTL
jgi:pyruvate dehydrogenase E2 component (dihydrolipoamide acetyltransferase)